LQGGALRQRVAVGGAAALAALLGTLMLFSASASAKLAPQISLDVPPRGIVHTAGVVTAESSSPEAPTLGSTTPSVCTLSPYYTGLGAPHPGAIRDFVNDIAPGNCTLVATLAETAEYEAGEAAKSFPVEAAGPAAVRTQQMVTLNVPTQATVGGSGEVSAEVPQGRVTLSSGTPAVCTLSVRKIRAPHPPASVFRRQTGTIAFIAPGICTISAQTGRITRDETVDGAEEAVEEYEPTKVSKSVVVTGPDPTRATPHIPARVRAVLLKDALRTRRARSSHPYDIQAIRTVSGKVPFLESLLPADTPIYLIAMRGHFWGDRAGEGGPIPARCNEGPAETVRARCPASVLEVAVSETFNVVAFRGSSSYPNLKALGNPVHLAAGKGK
jgi:hypothetical protein